MQHFEMNIRMQIKANLILKKQDFLYARMIILIITSVFLRSIALLNLLQNMNYISRKRAEFFALQNGILLALSTLQIIDFS